MSSEDKIKDQLAYYYSWDNLIKDLHLRGKMDQHGWVPVSQISSFPIMQRLVANIPTDPLQTIVRIAQTMEQLEVSADQMCLRPADNPTHWPLPCQVQIPERACLPTPLRQPVPQPAPVSPPGHPTSLHRPVPQPAPVFPPGHPCSSVQR